MPVEAEGVDVALVEEAEGDEYGGRYKTHSHRP
jgi:hypothetical protein